MRKKIQIALFLKTYPIHFICDGSSFLYKKYITRLFVILKLEPIYCTRGNILHSPAARTIYSTRAIYIGSRFNITIELVLYFLYKIRTHHIYRIYFMSRRPVQYIPTNAIYLYGTLPGMCAVYCTICNILSRGENYFVLSHKMSIPRNSRLNI